jgi:hypothetical protein
VLITAKEAATGKAKPLEIKNASKYGSAIPAEDLVATSLLANSLHTFLVTPDGRAAPNQLARSLHLLMNLHEPTNLQLSSTHPKPKPSVSARPQRERRV